MGQSLARPLKYFLGDLSWMKIDGRNAGQEGVRDDVGLRLRESRSRVVSREFSFSRGEGRVLRVEVLDIRVQKGCSSGHLYEMASIHHLYQS